MILEAVLKKRKRLNSKMKGGSELKTSKKFSYLHVRQ